MGNFIGHQGIIKSLNKRIKEDEISHAHILVGECGIGKSKLAKNIACFILRKDEIKDYIDIINYKTKKSSFGVDNVRDIIEEINKKPFEGDRKVVIIHDGNKLTHQAQNALLKTIEEPPSGVFIILLCESLELILDTIKSRCEIHKLTPLNKNEIRLFIETIEGEYSYEQINSAIAYSEGIPGRAYDFLNDVNLKELRDNLINLLYLLISGNVKNILDFEDKILAYKDKKHEILNILSSYVRDIMIYKEVSDTNLIINSDKINSIRDLANGLSYKKLNKIIDKVGEAREFLYSNSNFQLIIRVMLTGFMEV